MHAVLHIIFALSLTVFSIGLVGVFASFKEKSQFSKRTRFLLRAIPVFCLFLCTIVVMIDSCTLNEIMRTR